MQQPDDSKESDETRAKRIKASSTTSHEERSVLASVARPLRLVEHVADDGQERAAALNMRRMMTGGDADRARRTPRVLHKYSCRCFISKLNCSCPIKMKEFHFDDFQGEWKWQGPPLPLFLTLEPPSYVNKSKEKIANQSTENLMFDKSEP